MDMGETMKHKKLIELSLWFVVVIWAGNYTMGKFGMREFSPAVFTALRFLIAVPIMYLLLWWREGRVYFSRSDFPRIIVVGLVGVAIYQTLFISALKYTTATTVALALGISPVSTALFGAMAGQEKLNTSVIAGCLVSFSGLFMVIKFGYGEFGFTSVTLYGDILAFVAGILWGVYPILANPLLKKHSALWSTCHTAFAGMVCLMIYSFPEIISLQWQAISAIAWVSLLYSAIPVTVICLVLWYYGIENIGSNQVMIYMYMITPVAIVIAALTIGERINLLQGIGAVITMAGVVMVKRNPQKADKDDTFSSHLDKL